MIPPRQQLSIIAIASLFLVYLTYTIYQDVRARRLSALPTHLYSSEKYTSETFQDDIDNGATEYYEHLRAQLDGLIKTGDRGTPPSDDLLAEESGLAPEEHSEGHDVSSEDDKKDDDKKDDDKKEDDKKEDSSKDESSVEPSTTESPTEIFGIDPIMAELFGIQPTTTESLEEEQSVTESAS